MILRDPILRLNGVSKSFTLHQQGHANLDILSGLSFELAAGECLAVVGPSGVGKSTVLRLVYGNYKAPTGQILVRDHASWIDIATARPRAMIALRTHGIGYVSQFLRAVPRVSTLDVVAEPLLARGTDATEARERARAVLDRLAVPQSLWSLAPATFSGGEQQRVNIARGFVAPFPLLLLDEPTASLDARNRERVVELINERRSSGTAILGIFHDEAVRNAVATRMLDLAPFRAAA
jgi:alpha-D-ribose 1-methylphosphonate 5-triphosphate synthase subunit PhnL